MSDRPPNSFTLAILGGWAMIDPPAADSERVTLQRIPVGEQAPALGGLRLSLSEFPATPDGPGIQAHFSLHCVESEREVDAVLGVGFFAFGGDSRPEALMPVLAADALQDSFDIVRLQAGPALRREGVSSDGWVLRFYVPIPATSGECALLVFTGPGAKLSADVADHCDAMAGSFNFRFGQGAAPTPDELKEPLRALLEEQALESGGVVTADLGGGRSVTVSGREVQRRRGGAPVSPFIEERYGFRRIGWSGGRCWQAPELAAEAAAKETGRENPLVGRAAQLVWLAYSIAALIVAPGVTKAPFLLIGVSITITVLRRMRQDWNTVVVLAVLLGVVLVVAAGTS